MTPASVPVEGELDRRLTARVTCQRPAGRLDTGHPTSDQVHSHPHELPRLGVGPLSRHVIRIRGDEAESLCIQEVVRRQSGVIGCVPELTKRSVGVSEVEGVATMVLGRAGDRIPGECSVDRLVGGAAQLGVELGSLAVG